MAERITTQTNMTFPRVYTNRCTSIVISTMYTSTIQIGSRSLTGFSIYTATKTSTNVDWMAIGY